MPTPILYFKYIGGLNMTCGKDQINFLRQQISLLEKSINSLEILADSINIQPVVVPEPTEITPKPIIVLQPIPVKPPVEIVKPKKDTSWLNSIINLFRK